MKAKSIIMIGIVLLSVLFIAGCAEQATIKTSEAAGEAVNNISENVGSVEESLNEIDNILGGIE